MPSVQDLVTVIEERAIRSRIKQARKEAGLTQEQIAELIGVDDRTYQNYEREDDKGRTPWRMMNAIAAATDKSQEWLLHGEPASNGSDDRLARLEEMVGAIFKQLILDAEPKTEPAQVVRTARQQARGRKQAPQARGAKKQTGS